MVVSETVVSSDVEAVAVPSTVLVMLLVSVFRAVLVIETIEDETEL